MWVGGVVEYMSVSWYCSVHWWCNRTFGTDGVTILRVSVGL